LGNAKGRLSETGRFFRHERMKKVVLRTGRLFRDGGGKNVPVFTAGFSIINVNAIFVWEAEER
jgi:hypothetical protein